MNANRQGSSVVSPGPRAQRGASAVEFAFVFPILFLLVYGVIVYSYVYVIQQSITYSAQQSAEAAVAVTPVNDNAAYEAKIRTRVHAVALQSLNWLPANQLARLRGEDGNVGTVAFETIDTDQSVVRVTLDFQVPGLFPTLTLPLVGNIPPLPQRLRAQAIARI